MQPSRRKKIVLIVFGALPGSVYGILALVLMVSSLIVVGRDPILQFSLFLVSAAGLYGIISLWWACIRPLTNVVLVGLLLGIVSMTIAALNFLPGIRGLQAIVWATLAVLPVAAAVYLLWNHFSYQDATKETGLPD